MLSTEMAPFEPFPCKGRHHSHIFFQKGGELPNSSPQNWQFFTQKSIFVHYFHQDHCNFDRHHQAVSIERVNELASTCAYFSYFWWIVLSETNLIKSTQIWKRHMEELKDKFHKLLNGFFSNCFLQHRQPFILPPRYPLIQDTHTALFFCPLCVSIFPFFIFWTKDLV